MIEAFCWICKNGLRGNQRKRACFPSGKFLVCVGMSQKQKLHKAHTGGAPNAVDSKRVALSSIPKAHLTMSLEENAYAFLNQSLKHYRKTSRNIQEWPFALFHIVQSLELLLKKVLETINPILIYKDIDQASPEKHTVSLEQALIRLENLKVPIEEKERQIIRKAALKRNQVVHYKIELNRFEWKKLYAQLFEFIHFFHHKHLKTDIHSHITRDNWNVEARLMGFFKKNFVMYNGVEVYREHPKAILDSQRIHGFYDGQNTYDRIKYGNESGEMAGFFREDQPCGDCFVLKGQYHADGCDLEECPKCHGQALRCPCTETFLYDYQLGNEPSTQKPTG